MCKHCDKGVEGVAFMSEFQIFWESLHLFYDGSKFHVAEGAISIIKRAQCRIVLEGILKILCY